MMLSPGWNFWNPKGSAHLIFYILAQVNPYEICVHDSEISLETSRFSIPLYVCMHATRELTW
jgi:hypothetical protein